MFNADILEFTATRQQFLEEGLYTKAYPGTRSFMNFWDEQKRRSLEGYHTGRDYIPGYFYFYLNFSPIYKVKFSTNQANIIGQNIRGEREFDFPDFWDSDYEYFHYINEAELSGKHGGVLKARGRGYSFKGGSMLNRNYFLIPGSKNYVYAASEQYLIKDGTLTKAWDIMGFVDDNTAWTKRRQYKDTDFHKRASYQKRTANKVVEAGYKSEIMGVIIDDANKSRGKRGKLIIWEEAGEFKNLLKAWQVARPSVEQGKATFGTMIFQGCVCAGTKVWTTKGDLVNIENLKREEGILGYDGKGASKESISYWQEIIQKPCYRITTNSSRYLECSEDHPILKLEGYKYPKKERAKKYRPIGSGREPRKVEPRLLFQETKSLNVGDKIAILDSAPIFGDKIMWEPRVVGWLIGDGSYGFDKTPVLSNCEEEINNYIETNLDTVTEKWYRTKSFEGKKIYKETRIRGICAKLRELGIYGQTKLKKTLPIDIHSYRKEDICELLGGLFDTDGYVRYTEGKQEVQVNIASMSWNLLNEIRLLLQKIGIHCRISRIKMNPNNPKDRNDYFRLVIADRRSLLSFYKQIKLFPKQKQDNLETIVKLLENKKEKISKYFEGIRLETIKSIEYIGIKDVYNLTADTTHTYVANGIITHNTGGSNEQAAEGLEELFFNPEGYNIHHVPNTWEEGMEENRTALFVPAYLNMAGYIDEHGNSDIEGAKQELIASRELTKKKTRSQSALANKIAEDPFTPSEAFLRPNVNIFPTAELAAWEKVITNSRTKGFELTGELFYDETGKVKFKHNPELLPIYEYPVKKDTDKTGCIIVYSTPYRDKDGNTPQNLYYICHDPYGQSGEGGSLGAAYVLLRPNNQRQPDDCIVASYIGRPNSMDEYNKNLFMLAEYYNAKIGFENDRGDVISYAKRFKKLQWLEEEFKLPDNKELQSSRNRGYGMHMTDRRKSVGEVYLRDWLLTERSIDENGNKLLNLHQIYDVGLIRELIKYNPKGNFDRISAMLVGMFFDKELTHKKIKQAQIEKDPNSFFERNYIR